jgi:hypothetical protein
MRAKEFTINIPITIHLDADGTPNVDMKQNPETTDQLDQNPVFVPPLQQAIELHKAEHGKDSPVIDKLTQDQAVGQEEEPKEIGADELLQRLKQLISN